jgi:hypothetical protein
MFELPKSILKQSIIASTSQVSDLSKAPSWIRASRIIASQTTSIRRSKDREKIEWL